MIYIAFDSCENNYRSQHAKSLELISSLFSSLGYEDVTVTKSSKGRPVCDSTEIDISVTHSKNLVAVAAVCEKEIEDSDYFELPDVGSFIGIDIEEIDEATDLARKNSIAKKFLGKEISSPTEFYLGWTQHEAYGKMTGEGITAKEALPYNSYSFIIDADGRKYALGIAVKKADV